MGDRETVEFAIDSTKFIHLILLQKDNIVRGLKMYSLYPLFAHGADALIGEHFENEVETNFCLEIIWINVLHIRLLISCKNSVRSLEYKVFQHETFMRRFKNKLFLF